MHVQVFMGVDGKAFMNDMINTGRGDDEGESAQAKPDTHPGKHGYNIGTGPLFPTNGMPTDGEMTVAALPRHLPGAFPTPRGSVKGRQATCQQRTRFFAKLGWIYQPIPFAAPSKWD
jgi:hypothetical protein